MTASSSSSRTASAPITDSEVEQWRQDTPGCLKRVHFNNAGSALPPRPVVETVKSFLDLEAEVGGYEAAEAKDAELEGTYVTLARLVGARPHEIAFIENATRAWDMAFYAFEFERGDRILTAQAEYASNYIAFLQVAQRTGAKIEVVPNDEQGQLCVASLTNMIDDRTKLVAVTHIPTNGGLVNPAKQIGQITRQAGVPFLLDACQAVGQLPIDVEDIGCDILSATGRKYLRGPRGTGFLYVREGLIEKLTPPFLDLLSATWTGEFTYQIREDARRFETWERYVAGQLGLATAAEYAVNIGLERIEARVTALANHLRQALSAIAGVTVQDIGAQQCGIVTFTVDGFHPEEIKRHLHAQQINVSTSTKSGTRLDMEARNLNALVRASVHYYNTDTEIIRFVEALNTVMTA